MKTIFITGATAGFGKAIAQRFAANQFQLIICGRRNDRLQQLKTELESTYNTKVFPLCFDVRVNDEVIAAVNSLPAEFSSIDILVNNAGLASGLSHIQDGDVNDWDKMIDTNVKGLLYVTSAVLPLMKKSAAPHIVNIGSTAAKYVYEKGNVYNGSKFAVDALNQAMRIDLLKPGVKVTGIDPGAAETEFSLVRFHGDAEKAKSVYNGFKPLEANDIADVCWYVCNLPQHVCINDLIITPTAQASPYYINRQ